MSEEVKSESEKKKEDWMNSKWRPMMGWMYMLVCTMDFVIFPILWAMFHATMHSSNITQWQPLTLQGAGLFHMAMGAVIGVAAFGRTQEKLAGKANDNSMGMPMIPTSQSVTTTYGSAPSFSPSPVMSPVATQSVTTGFGGKLAPPAAPQPLL